MGNKGVIFEFSNSNFNIPVSKPINTDITTNTGTSAQAFSEAWKGDAQRL